MSKSRLLVMSVCVVLIGTLGAAAADETALLKQAQGIFQPLPTDLATPKHPVKPERVELGRMLFFDPRLTIDGNVGCSSCHQPAFCGTDARPRAIGVKQRLHPHNAPTMFNIRVLDNHSLAR